jgi:hypothetical protein
MVCATCRQPDDDEDEEYDESDPSHRRQRLHPEAGQRTSPESGKESRERLPHDGRYCRALIKDFEKGLLGSGSGRLQLKGFACVTGVFENRLRGCFRVFTSVATTWRVTGF